MVSAFCHEATSNLEPPLQHDVLQLPLLHTVSTELTERCGDERQQDTSFQ